MAHHIAYLDTPIGSLLILDEAERSLYWDTADNIPPSVSTVITNVNTAYFLRGVAKNYDVPLNEVPKIALALLRILVGDKTLAQMPATLSSELKISNDKAQKIADEIEKELIAPISLELNQYLKSKKDQDKPSVTDKVSKQDAGGTSSPENVLNLKDSTSRNV